MLICDIEVEVVRKNIRNVHLSVYPPEGRVRLAAPRNLKEESLRLFVLDKLSWIKRQQAKFQQQEREPQRQYVPSESIYLWGKRYLLEVVDGPPALERGMVDLTLSVPPGANRAAREAVMMRYYRQQVRERLPELLAEWAPRLGVTEPRIYVQDMKTLWGSCNPSKGLVRLNLQLARKNPICLKYILVHELAHLLEHTHNARFQGIMNYHLPNWQHYRDELNRAPLAHVDWEY